MRSGKQEYLGRRPSMAARLRDPRIHMGSNPCLMPLDEVMERSPRPRRSLSPPVRVMGGGERRSGSFKGRNYDWEVGGGTVRAERDQRFRSQSPPFGRGNNTLRSYDEGFTSSGDLRRKYEFCDVVDGQDEFDTGIKQSGFRVNVNRDRALDDTGEQLLSRKGMVLEHSSSHRGEYRFQTELEPTLRHAEDAGKYSSSSRNSDFNRFNNQRNHYPDPFLLEKLVAMETYGKGEKYAVQSSDVPSSKGSVSLSKDFVGASHLKEIAGTSSGSSRKNFMSSYLDDVPLAPEVHPSSSAQQVEQYSFTKFHQRHSLETKRNSEASNEDLLGYKRAAFSPSMIEGRARGYVYPGGGFREKDEEGYNYPSEDLGERIRFRELVDYPQRDIITSNFMKPTKNHMDHADYAQRVLRSSDLQDHSSSRNKSASEYLLPNRSLAVAEEVRMYTDPERANVEFDNNVLIEPEASLRDISPNGISRRRTTHGSARDAHLVSGRESMRISPETRYEMEMLEYDSRTKGIYSDELDTYDPSRRSLKRKYLIHEELSSHSTKGTPSSNMYNLSGRKDQNERGDEWNDRYAIDFSPSRGLEYNRNRYRRAGKTVEIVEHGRDSLSNDQWFYHDPVEHVQEHSGKSFKYGKRTLKDHPRHGLLSSYNPHNFSKKHGLTKNVWERGKDNKQLEECANETQELKFRVSSSVSGPPEDSKEFNQLVQAFFLSFSKMINESVGTRKRYQEQGRAGSLFCIVCGKSKSKEFRDTQGLATHCFMSKKVGLRAEHLGLHKAICVLLGWNSVAVPDVITFTPQSLSSSKALAQKEDLILWPPIVIIHSISISASHPEGQKVFKKEAVEDFLRGKGFSVGKIKVSLGMFNNIMVVKFLGTFPGLQDAEKLHKYFVDVKHGRIDFKQTSLIKGKDHNTRKERMQGNKLEEHVLYGYMGISEDLDKVDFDTKRKCSIKSKKEIEDIANEPLKS